MRLKELAAWAADNGKKENVELMRIGVSERELHKVRSYLRMIVDKCERVVDNTKQNEDYMKDIEEYLGHLTKSKFPIPDHRPKDSILPEDQ